jgi:polyisoprenoid-binding protein YceI
MTRPGTPQSPSRRPLWLVAGIVAIALIAGGAYGLWYVFFRPSGPAAIADSTLTVPSSAAGASAPLTGGTSGTWKVDTSIGSFSDFTDSWVGYRVQEQLASIGGNTAVGRTPDVSGSLTVDGTKITAVDIQADLTSLKSDDDRRDGQLARQGIQTASFPTATFKLTSPIDLGSVPADGQEVSVTATGDLTLHGQTKSVQFPLKAKLSGSTVVVTGSLDIAFADYGIQKPNSFMVLSIADTATIELQLFFTKSA